MFRLTTELQAAGPEKHQLERRIGPVTSLTAADFEAQLVHER